MTKKFTNNEQRIGVIEPAINGMSDIAIKRIREVMKEFGMDPEFVLVYAGGAFPKADHFWSSCFTRSSCTGHAMANHLNSLLESVAEDAPEIVQAVIANKAVDDFISHIKKNNGESQP